MVLIALTLLLDFMTRSFLSNSSGVRHDPGFAVLTGVLSLAYPTVGALIASRLPTNPIGWIFCGLGLLYAMQRFTIAYADYALLETFGLPWGRVRGLVLHMGKVPEPTLGVFLMLLFPGGRLPSRRWRIVAWVAVLGAALSALGVAFHAGILLPTRYVGEPIRSRGVIGGRFTTYGLFGVSTSSGMTLLLTSLLAALFSLILRLRRARGNDRQQTQVVLVRRRAVNRPA